MANTKSANFDRSSSQYLSITDANQTGLDFGSGDFTIEFRMKTSSTVRSFMFDKREPSGNHQGFYLQLRGDLTNNYLAFYVKDSSGHSLYADNDTASGNVIDGAWHYVALVRQSSALYIYLDGNSTPYASDSGTSVGDTDNTNELRLGQVSIGSGFYYDGLMDEIIVWSEARTPTQIAESYNSGNGKIYTGTETNMQAYWRMEDDFTDETANSNDLTNNNGVTFDTDVPFTGGTPAPTSYIPQIIMS